MRWASRRVDRSPIDQFNTFLGSEDPHPENARGWWSTEEAYRSSPQRSLTVDSTSKPEAQEETAAPLLPVGGNDPAHPPVLLTNKGQLWRVLIFAGLEVAWLIFALICHWQVVVVPHVPLHVGNVHTSDDVFFRGLFTSITIIWQISAAFPLKQVLVDAFASEWAFMLRRGRATAQPDAVSVLTSGLVDRAAHTVNRQSSWRFRFAFLGTLALAVLTTIAPGTVTISNQTVSSHAEMKIGALQAGRTNGTVRTNIVEEKNAATLLSEALALRAARLSDVAQVDHMLLNINSPSDIVFGMPMQSDISAHVTYISDAVRYNFTCQWVAPTLLGFTSDRMDETRWSFDDLVGSIDYLSESQNRSAITGFWPLIIESGPGATNGSLAWVTLGGDGEALINLALIPEPNRTFNGSGWWDLNIDQQETDGPQSRIASVLFCDPHLEYTTVVATLSGRTITLDNAPLKTPGRVGNLDPGEVSRMFSRALNGIVYDQELAYPEASATLSRSSAEFILQPANDSANFVFLPQDLANVSQSMNEYMRVVASNTYLEGSLGTFDTRVEKLEMVERLQVSWLQWGLTAGFVVVAALLSIISVVHNKDEERYVAFTIAAVVKALRETYGSDTAGSAVARPDPTDDLKPVESLDAPSKPSDQSATSYNGPAVQAMSMLNKAWRIVFFAVLEATWLVFGYVTYWHVILVPHLSVHLAGLNPSNDVLFRGLFTTISIIWQLLAIFPLKAILVEAFACEWSHMLRYHDLTDSSVDRVSIITSGILDQVKHSTTRRATLRFRLAFLTSLILLVVGPLAPGAITIASDVTTRSANLTIGAMPPGQTNGTYRSTLIDANDATLLSNALALRAARQAYVAQVEHASTTFDIPEGLLFAMPMPANASDHVQYISDGVRYNVTCRWLAPTLDGNAQETFDGLAWTIEQASWNFSDMVGTPDYLAEWRGRSAVTYLWPLLITSGAGATNGSLAWLLLGNLEQGAINLSSIPPSARTHNASGWIDPAYGATPADAKYTTIASVLYCDPHLENITITPTLSQRTIISDQPRFIPLDYNVTVHNHTQKNTTRDGTVGNIDYGEVSRMFGRALNGIAYDSVLANPASAVTGFNFLPRLAAEMLFHAPDTSGTYKPQDIANITGTINSLMRVVASAYLDGFLGTVDVSGATLEVVQRLQVSWTQWYLALGLVSLTVALACIVVISGIGKEGIPLTIGAIEKVVEGKHSRERSWIVE